MAHDWMDHRFEILTPMFLGGGREQVTGFGDGAVARAEMRPPSLRGALRRWFRILSAPHFGHSVTAITAAENAVFGSTENSSVVRVRLVDAPIASRESTPEWLPRTGQATDVRYLLGQGLYANGALTRPHLPPGQRGTFRVAAGPYRELVTGLLWFLTHFGGLGSRARRVFGSLDLQVPDDWPSSPWEDDGFTEAFARFSDELQQFGSPRYQEERGPFLRMPSAADWEVFPQRAVFGDWVGAANSAATILRSFRATEPAGQRWRTPEYKAVAEPFVFGSLLEGSGFPLAGFGLPASFTVFDRRSGQRPVVTVTASRGGGEIRRPSSLTLRLVRVGEGFSVLIQVFRQAALPDGATVGIQQTNPPASRRQSLSIDSQTAYDRLFPPR